MKTTTRNLIMLVATMFALLSGCAIEPGEDEIMSERWERLSDGQALGKRVVIAVPFTNFGEPRPGTVDILQINGKDSDACQIAITLLPPEYTRASDLPGGVFPQKIEDLSGSRYNNSFVRTDALFAPPAVAIVKWGVGGVQSIAEVDFSNGSVINVTASFLRVDAFVDLPSRSFPEPVAVTLGAFAGPGWPKPNNAQRSYNVFPLLPGPAGFPEFSYDDRGYFTPTLTPFGMYPVPWYGKQAWLLASDANVAAPSTLNTLDANLSFFYDSAGTVLAGSYQVSNENPGPILVPNGAKFWSVENNAAESQDLQVIFDLSI